MSRRTVKVTCTVMIQVDCNSTWNADTTVDQVHKQAEEDAVGRIHRVFTNSVTDDDHLSCKRDETLRGLKMIGVTKTVSQIVEE